MKNDQQYKSNMISRPQAVIVFAAKFLFWVFWVALTVHASSHFFGMLPMPPWGFRFLGYTPSIHWFGIVMAIACAITILTMVGGIIEFLNSAAKPYFKIGKFILMCFAALFSGSVASFGLLSIGDIATRNYGEKILNNDLCLVDTRVDCYEGIKTVYLQKVNLPACVWLVSRNKPVPYIRPSGYCLPEGEHHDISGGKYDIILIFRHGFFGWKAADFKIVAPSNFLKKQDEDLREKINIPWWERGSPWLEPSALPPFISGEPPE